MFSESDEADSVEDSEHWVSTIRVPKFQLAEECHKQYERSHLLTGKIYQNLKKNYFAVVCRSRCWCSLVWNGAVAAWSCTRGSDFTCSKIGRRVVAPNREHCGFAGWEKETWMRILCSFLAGRWCDWIWKCRWESLSIWERIWSNLMWLGLMGCVFVLLCQS